MEYYGKILCISKNDLTRDDRPVQLANGNLDYSQSREINGMHPSMWSLEVLAPIMSESCYKLLVYRGKILVVRKGVGRGVSALVSVESLPEKYKKRVEEKYGDMDTEALRNWFGTHWEIDQAAQSWYSLYRLPSGKPLTPEQQQEYTLNASALQAVVRLMNDTKMKRAVMQGSRVRWEEMSGAISFYQKEFGHTLPTSPARFKKRVKEFQEKSYASLISGKFCNQNTRKVNVNIERLLLALATMPNKPWNKDVWAMYTDFVNGRLTVFDPKTGEVFNPADFRDKNGQPMELSPSTVNAYLNQPKNKALVNNALMSWSTFMHEQRPHVHRHSPEFSFSKISFDDRDLPRKLKDTKARPKAYYAYDVASQCVVGFAYNRNKNVDLVVDMFRSMFRLIEHKGWCCPAQVEVENHLMSQWKDSFLKAGVVFPFVRFCAALNSQEKRAEHFNGAKKKSVEHRNHLGIGRFYAKNEKYRTESKKVSDELNDTYEDREYYTWEQLIAEDMADVREFNNSLHPNQKKYPGMTRWQVLEANMNPNLQPLDKAMLYRFIGEHVSTSIRRNSYCRVAYKDYWLSDPDVLDKLEPNNLKVDAYYLPDENGETGDVYIYQNGNLIDRLKDVGTFNEALAEQTDEDTRIMTEQNKLISKFDALMKREAVAPVAVMKAEAARQIQDAPARPAPAKEEENADFLNYDVSGYKGAAIKSI